jgi:hypothetical protein
VANGHAFDTATVGDKTFHVASADAAGHDASLDQHYSVTFPFRGFLFPVQNAPVLNKAFAGLPVLLRFSLTGNRGLGIIAAGYPQSKGITCPAGATVVGTPETTTYQPGLLYIKLIDQYIYVLKTDKTWAGTCRSVTMKLTDGTEHVANFKFFK